MIRLLKRAAGSQDKYEVIYLCNEGCISQRIIKVLKVTDDCAKAYCYSRGQYRTFKLVNILLVGPVRKRVGA
ncbi:hypothetical protein [Bacillus sp. FSL K6-3431]|uniref:hypothetical protein n=1 Tax=Bacillus sp. FSL K6-3431 TaxID=2921500 RepID=UPI0030F61178